jgi:NSS family neurotransmitter:Na+ symporter
MATSQTEVVGRDQWATKVGFLLAAMGSAIGLGNIWRFPYVVYENGGGAFLIPYFVAILTAALPILILEYALGHLHRSSAPHAFRQVRRGWEWLGWWQVAVAFFIATYYVVILGWCLAFVWYSVGQQWGEDTAAFFIGDFLQTSEGGAPEGFWQVGGPVVAVLVPVLIAWAMIYTILRGGVRRGIERASRVLMPLLVVLLLVLVIRGVTLEGAGEGLNVLFTPDFGALADPGVWIAAYGQVFFSMSIAFSIMIAYASYLPRRTDLTNSAFVVGLANSSFEFLAAIGVFSVLGFLAVASGSAVTDVAGSGGVGLAFIAFPQIINTLPGLNSVIGIVFFLTLFFAGLSSMVSILEPGIAAVREKFHLSRTAAVNILCGAAFVVSLVYTTRGGLFYLDTADRFLNNFGLVVSGLLEVVLVAWVGRELVALRRHVNEISYIRVGAWWTVSLSVITPVLLGFMTVYNVWTEVNEPYAGYPASGLLVVGWGVVALTLVIALLLSQIRKDREMRLEG